MKIKEIMVKEVESMSPDISAKEAMDILFKLKISGLPVMDRDGKLVGMCTEKEILSYLLPSYVYQVGSFVYEENTKAIKKKLEGLNEIKVNEIMRKEAVVVNEDATLFEVAKIMLTKNARRLPVIDGSKKVLGIVARCDVLRAMVKEE